MTVSLSPTHISRQAARCLAALLSLLMVVQPVVGQSSAGSTTAPAAPDSSATTKKAAPATTTTAKTATKTTGTTGKKARRPRQRASRAVRRARTARIKLAFVASTELRPMAQQLATLRTPAAYAGVTKYAHEHTGEAAAAAYLALGHAYWLDKRYEDAAADFKAARKAGEELADYADFLGARASRVRGGVVCGNRSNPAAHPAITLVL